MATEHAESFDYLPLARRGAEIRLMEIRDEVAAFERFLNAGESTPPTPAIHWSQTPEGKRRISRNMRRRWRRVKAAAATD